VILEQELLLVAEARLAEVREAVMLKLKTKLGILGAIGKLALAILDQPLWLEIGHVFQEGLFVVAVINAVDLHKMLKTAVF
jgi:hypothetical protein